MRECPAYPQHGIKRHGTMRKEETKHCDKTMAKIQKIAFLP